MLLTFEEAKEEPEAPTLSSRELNILKAVARGTRVPEDGSPPDSKLGRKAYGALFSETKAIPDLVKPKDIGSGAAGGRRGSVESGTLLV